MTTTMFAPKISKVLDKLRQPSAKVAVEKTSPGPAGRAGMGSEKEIFSLAVGGYPHPERPSIEPLEVPKKIRDESVVTASLVGHSRSSSSASPPGAFVSGR